MSGDVYIRHRIIENIPLLEISLLENDSNNPLVILCHGFRSRKESLLPQAYFMAQLGLFVVLPDAYMHGERNREDLDFDVFEVVDKTADEIDILIDAYDRNKNGIAGYSMGGFIMLSYAMRKTGKINAFASVISTPDWVSVMKSEYAAEYFEKHGILSGSDKMKELLNETERIQPLEHYMDLAGIPLLMINGDSDPIISLNGPQKMYELLRPKYINKEDLVFSVYKGVGHDYTHTMDREAAAWFEKYLL